MEVRYYPLVCWNLPDDLVLGQLVGSTYELVAPGLRKLKLSITRRLERDLQRNPSDVPRPLKNGQMKIHKVAIQSGYKTESGAYPSSSKIDVPVAAVYGPNDLGSFTCYLPQLDKFFYYFREGQIEAMVEHYARATFQDAPPEEVHRYLLAPEPWLDFITLKVKAREESPESDEIDLTLLVRTLTKVAERLPHTKGLKRKISALPTAAWGREEIVRSVADKMQKERANILVVGESGVGKSAVLAAAIDTVHAESRTGDAKGGRHAWRTTSHRMIAQAKYLGEWQEIVEKIVVDLQRTQDILWLVDIITMLRTGGDGAENSIAAYLLPHLDRGDIQIVGEMSPQELEAARRLLPGFVDRFQIVRVDEMPRATVSIVLDKLGEHVKQGLSIELTREALEATQRLLARHVPYERFPGKAVRFLSSVVNDAHLAEKAKVTEREVLDAFVRRTGLPEILLRDDMRLDTSKLHKHFVERIVGQEEAVAKIASVIKVFKAGLNDPGKPIATLLFAGPTGVGKTASAKALAEYVFGAGQKLDPLVRLDMSEFQDPMQIERLIGGGGEPGAMVARLRERPFSVVLLDEIEKAHAAFFDALLTLLDEGVLVDAYGRTTDFRNAIIAMTTNLGTRRTGSLGFAADAAPGYEADIRAFFRPEFFNRIDQVVTFRPLGPDAIRSIAAKELREIGTRAGMTARGLKLQISAALIEAMCAVGFDPVYGARPLQRAVEQHVVGPLAKWLLQSKARKATLRLDWVDGALSITTVK